MMAVVEAYWRDGSLNDGLEDKYPAGERTLVHQVKGKGILHSEKKFNTRKSMTSKYICMLSYLDILIKLSLS